MAAAPLAPDNIHAFWGAAWREGRTGWKTHEKNRPFESNMEKFLQALSAGSEDDEGLARSTAAAAVSAFVAGKRVLVPLCGDSGAVRYFVDRGAGLVVGVDVVAASLQRSLLQNFPACDGFVVATSAAESTQVDAQREEGSGQSASEGGGTTTVHRVFEESSNALVCVLVCGDFLDPSLASTFGPFDFVYDRASMVAMPPSLRQRYADQVVRCTKPGARFLLELVRRPAEEENDGHLARGPPFHIPDETVVAHYQAALAEHGDRVPQLVPLDTSAAEALSRPPAEGTTLPDFVFSLYLVKL